MTDSGSSVWNLDEGTGMSPKEEKEEKRNKKEMSKIQVCRRRKVGRLENEKKNEEKVQKV